MVKKLKQPKAERYLNRQNATDELYHESFKNVSVIFASIPNYSKLNREHKYDKDGTKCLKVLNEIISDFDMLTYDDLFQTIEKIKIVGSTYMAACGLHPDGDEVSEAERSMEENVSTIAKFAAAMFKKLEVFNSDGFQEFQLRVGINAGPVIAGVIGAHKPMYDIWGDTVNVASRMDYTGESGKIHVTATAGDILQGLGWSVTCRGEIKVKGKGFMTTYYVDPMSAPKEPSPLQPPDTPSNNNNNDNKNRKSSQDTTGERRRSSQLSLTSIKGFLSSHRGSLDINTSKDVDTQSTRSLPIYKPIKNETETTHRWEMEDLGSVGTTPRSSFDSKDSGVVKGSYRPSYPSPVAEEAEWTAGAASPLQKHPSKSSVSMIQTAPGHEPLRGSNDNEIFKQLINCKSKPHLSLKKNSSSSPDLSRTPVKDSTSVKSSFTIGASRKSSKSKNKRCTNVRQAQDHLLAHSSPHTSIMMDSEEVQSVWL
ncbi:Adenylate cyclase type 2 [Chionoecetes opilio]|uniref:adenylate cyclase n=1 Tax=Chionoecetes opilio TaxID=41210 RepID=A0A8J5CM38_CHIOP|nr:Adenylate cyclase type 2 [Chionoecetes opilio]